MSQFLRLYALRQGTSRLTVCEQSRRSQRTANSTASSLHRFFRSLVARTCFQYYLRTRPTNFNSRTRSLDYWIPRDLYLRICDTCLPCLVHASESLLFCLFPSSERHFPHQTLASAPRGIPSTETHLGAGADNVPPAPRQQPPPHIPSSKLEPTPLPPPPK